MSPDLSGTGTQRQRFRRKMMPSQPFFHSTGAKTPAYATVGLSLEVKLFKQLLNTEFRLEQGLLDLYNICQNRVGGKRSSFLPTFVFRPLTPPYVRFRIRRFLILRAI